NLLERLMKTADRKTAPWLLNIRGLQLEEGKKYAEAYSLYRRAIDEFDRQFVPAYINIALLMSEGRLGKERDYDGAIEVYRQIAWMASRSAVACNNWGLLLLEKKNYGGAIEKIERALEIEPNFVAAHYSYARVLHFRAQSRDTGADDKTIRREYDKAIAKYGRVIELDPRHAGAYMDWGTILDRFKDYSGAIEKYERAAAIDPN